MEKKRPMQMLCVLLFTVLVVSAVSVSGEKWKKQNFIDLWQKVRKTVVDKNLEEFKKLTIPADPEESDKMTQEDFGEFVDFFLIDMFPEWTKVNFIKFDQNDKAAILILQLHLDNEEWKDWIALYAYRFILTEGRWKLSGQLYDKSLSKSSDAEENKQRIAKELKENTDLQL